MKKWMVLLLVSTCVLSLTGCFRESENNGTAKETNPIKTVVPTETEPQTESANRPVLDCKSLEAACADSFIDPSKVTVLGGEWAYTADPNKFVALATVRYTAKDEEYEVAEIVMVGTFGGKTELFHNLNEHSPYTKENVLAEFGAVDGQRFPLA